MKLQEFIDDDDRYNPGQSNALIDHVGKYFFATGFTGRGLMHSPAVGLALSEMILEKHLTFDLSAYKLNRTPNLEKYVI